MKNGNQNKKPNDSKFKMPKLVLHKPTNDKENDIEKKHKTNNQMLHAARTPVHDGLAYSFNFHKAKLHNKDKDRANIEQYVYDLESTWNINIDMFKTLHTDLSPNSSDQNKSLDHVINRIKDLFEKKKNLRQEKHKIRGKILMDKQILEEFKRRIEENDAYYQEQIDEFNENIDKKDSFIKQFEKKFNEVEIYVQREAKSKPREWHSFLNFEILAFIDNNELLQRRIITINEEILTIKDDMNEVLSENVELKKREEFVDTSEDFDNKKSKYNSLIKLYKNKIKFLQRNSEHLALIYKSITDKLLNITSWNCDLNEKIKSEDIKTYTHSKSNSIAAIKFSENYFPKKFNNNQQNKDKIYKKKESDVNTINESVEEAIARNFSEDENCRSQPEIFGKINTENSETDNSMIIHKTAEFNFKENWDISCINFTNI